MSQQALALNNPVGPRRPVQQIKVSGTQTEINIEDIPSSEVKRPIEWFIKLPEHDRQRNTARHAAYALKHHLSRPAPTHKKVNAAVYQGKVYKVDGHTRAYLWERDLLKKPKMLDVTLWDVGDNEEHFLYLYNLFDTKTAAETAQDAAYGASRQHQLNFQSKFMQKNSFSSALRAVGNVSGISTKSHQFDIYKMVGLYKDELEMLDSIDPSPTVFKAGVMAGALLVLKRHGSKALPFFANVNDNLGVKTATECDAVQALRDVIAASVGGSNGMGMLETLGAKTISCAERWLKGERYAVSKNGVHVKRTDMRSYAKLPPKNP